jgi:2-polyprenyl-6-methoxyphenol hydroxylase-like FAD-dependent oxidoreductase
MRVLISGAGIAGPTLAFWLARYGFETTIVESAPGLKTGGYVIDFWGAGFDIADRMELLPEIRRNGYLVREVRIENRSGKRIAGFSTDSFSRIAGGRFVSLARGDLAATIFAAIEGRVEAVFGDSVERIEQGESSVRVTFRHAGRREFDLVIGADGLHSRIRQIVFGEQSRFERYLGYKAAAFEVEGYEPRDELAYVMYTQVGQQVVRFAMRNKRTMFLLTFKDADSAFPGGIQEQKTLLRKRFEDSGWECPQILDAMDRCSDLYFDRVSQIRMESESGLWTRGRVTLLGDAASCVSLLAGQGSALAMVAAYILAGELNRARGDYALAFARYQQLFNPFILMKQKAALRLAGFFAPKSRLAMLVRNQVVNLMTIPWIADAAIGRDLVDKIAIPEY